MRIDAVNGEKFLACPILPFIHNIQASYLNYFSTSFVLTGKQISVVDWFKKELSLEYDDNTQEIIFKDEQDLLLFVLKWS